MLHTVNCQDRANGIRQSGEVKESWILLKPVCVQRYCRIRMQQENAIGKQLHGALPTVLEFGAGGFCRVRHSSAKQPNPHPNNSSAHNTPSPANGSVPIYPAPQHRSFQETSRELSDKPPRFPLFVAACRTCAAGRVATRYPSIA